MSISKEELTTKLEEINSSVSQEERVQLLQDLSIIMKDANKELEDLYKSVKSEMG